MPCSSGDHDSTFFVPIPAQLSRETALCPRCSGVNDGARPALDDRVRTAVIDASIDDLHDPSGNTQCRYLTPVANRPLLEHVIASLAGTGIGRVVIVTIPEVRQRLESVVRGGRPWGVDATFLDTPDGITVPALVSRLHRVLDGRPIIYQTGDCLFPGAVRRLCESFTADRLDLAVLVRGGGPRWNADQHLSPAGPGVALPRDQPPGTALVLDGAATALLERLPNGMLGMRALIRSLQNAGGRVGACEVNDYWCYRDSPDDLLVANRVVLDGLAFEAPPPDVCEDTDTEGRVGISPSAWISGSTIRGPALIDADAVVTDSFIGPYTAIGAGARVTGAEIEYAMVLAGAEVNYPGQRLQASVIGEHAVVSQSFGFPSGLHLRIGPGARVILG